ncbi:hypothetical protein BUALT_Bualt06G0040400 [Buddleja alternifolia]|uniref:Uncharacterized protein n=1 Tax=Buddleja alternifolia TaxID=168488 RepID=A0AAV6XKI9_9LAMI|nr:hypothetical protein BUALT_Bualt06G0040400 [Buddleja alternifolia]
MSRHAQLPPRCPLQKKTTTCRANFSTSPPISVLEEPPAWLNDLLSDSDSKSNGTSDSLTLFNGLVPLPDLDQSNETETEDSGGPENGLESSCTYGPYSPRRKNKLGFPEKEIVSAFSDYIMQKPLQHLDGYFSVSGVPPSDSLGDAYASVGQSNTESISMKRSDFHIYVFVLEMGLLLSDYLLCHPGQRSRIRKLEYIAELERSVDILQNVGSELGVRVASLLQRYAALSLENNTLKQQMHRMQHQKYLVDGEYSSLKKEVEMLKIGLSVPSSNNKVHRRSLSAANITHSDAVWSMLDLRKLDLN